MPHESHFAESPASVGIDPEKLAVVFARARKEVDEGLLPSSQIAIARNGRIAAMQSVGTVKHEGEPAPATDTTLYCVFSATKAITSAAAWMLIEEGKLGLSERVSDIVPAFASNGKDAVTVEQLFTHTAGFPNAPFLPEAFLDREKRLAYFERWRLEWEPGSRFVYHPSSSMYVIADLLEQRSGVSYGEFVRRRIAEPLGLDDLWCGLPAALHRRLADIQHVGSEMTEADYAKLGMPVPPVTEVTEEALQRVNEAAAREAGIPGGGGTMTAADLALFYQALLHGRRLPDGEPLWRPETLAMAREVRSGELRDPVFRKLANRGLGLIIAGDAERNYRGFGHTNSPATFGHNGAGGQLAWADPETGISIGYCTDGHDRNAVRQARRGIGIASRAALCADA